MKRVFLQFLVSLLVCFLANQFIEGVTIAERHYLSNLLLFASLLSLSEIVFYPILKFFPFPFRLLTFNIVLLLFYMAQIFIADFLIEGVEVSNFQALLYFSLLNFLAQKIVLKQ